MGLTKKKRESSTSDLSDDAIGSLGSTVGSFESRINRKLAEQAEQSTQAEIEAQQRNDRILQALNTIRRALQETQKIKLGERFKLDLDVNDWNGWPRLDLNLVDSLDPENSEFTLIVTAHDRKESGSVEFRTNTGEHLGSVALTTDAELGKIPVVLKRAVRAFLDSVAEYVLNPKSAEELLQGRIELEEETPDPEAQKLQSVDVFEEGEVHYDKNQVQHEGEAPLPSSIDASFDK